MFDKPTAPGSRLQESVVEWLEQPIGRKKNVSSVARSASVTGMALPQFPQW